MDIVGKLLDLQEQATTEKSHYYVASCITEAIQEIASLRKLTSIQFDKEGFQICPMCKQKVHGPIIEIK